ncbi:hypothetical protein [Aestuariibacter salexigens]|uniref:hypothetical protein n=1 Tax=Aestuariibacter salexigens TaxID=226010 RepID=UPI00040E3168|nr:hypothetical protein [Aestuariibacter salexigens]
MNKLALFLYFTMLFTPYLFVGETLASSGAEHTQYYRHIMFRETPYAVYRGIHQLHTDDSHNVALYAFDYDAQGRIKEISYQINGNMINANEVWDSFIWFAPKVKINYQPGKEVHTYYDSNDQQISAHGNVYQAVYTLDEDNNRVSLHFYDKQGEPSENAWNIHRYQWRTADGKVFEKRFNLLDEQQPIRPQFTFYEVELEYDQDGKLAFVRNLGLTGQPTNNESGAGIDRIVYDQEGNFSRWMVYDKDGNPVEGNRPMVHIGEHLYDAFGNKVGMRGFDRKGKRIPFSWGAYEHKLAYNEFGNQVSHIMFKSDGSFDRHLTLEYSDENTHITWLKSLDEHGQLTASPMLGGAAALRYVYQNDGTRQRELFSADMTTFSPSVQEDTE